MELQRLQWLVSSETGERLSLLLFLDLQSTKATYLHTYLHYLYMPVYPGIQVCTTDFLCYKYSMQVQAVAASSLVVVDERCHA